MGTPNSRDYSMWEVNLRAVNVGRLVLLGEPGSRGSDKVLWERGQWAFGFRVYALTRMVSSWGISW